MQSASDAKAIGRSLDATINSKSHSDSEVRMAEERSQVSFEVKGLEHTNPIPSGCRVGRLLATSAIAGCDSETGIIPDDGDCQARHAFANLRQILAVGGANLGDVVKITVYLADDRDRSAVNKYWRECFPDPHHRPARHVLYLPLRGKTRVQLEALAVIKEDR